MPADLDNPSPASGEGGVSSSGNKPKSVAKKKRNLPGMPDPNAEVIALSPKSLLATNRFVCEICSKGFQRDQNLQLHRRGHNLPWKLRQRTSSEIKKRVYVCPEVTCIHNDPSRALGDLTGIKKHFCRKHGEKKWKCDKCSKKYAVQSDWKAHSKICGAREYKCDCGTLFSRRDSFITHRAFCDVLAQESAKTKTVTEAPNASEEPMLPMVAPPSSPPSSPPPPPSPPPETEQPPPLTPLVPSSVSTPNPEEVTESRDPSVSPARILEDPPVTNGCNSSTSSSSSNKRTPSSTVFASLFASSTASRSLPSQPSGFIDIFQNPTPDLTTPEPISLCLATNQGSSVFGYTPPAMSATALLQKAAQMGCSSTTNGSLLRGLGLSDGQQEWDKQTIESQNTSLAAGLGLGLSCDTGSGLKELMWGTPSVYGPKHTTLDLLGLGMAASGGPTNKLSALMTSINGEFGNGEFTGKDMGMSS